MKNHANHALMQVLVVGVLTANALSPARAELTNIDPAVESVVRGDQAYAFPAGYIRKNQPFDGLINQVTGDNQVTGNRMISSGTHVVYVRLNNPQDVAIGDLFTVYRRYHKVFHPVTRQYMGELIHQLGVIKILEIEGKLASARVVASYDAIGPGENIMRFSPPESTPLGAQPVSQVGSDLDGLIVDFLANRTLIGQRQMVYLDRGRNDGLRLGDYLEIFRTGGGLPRRVLGEVKIVGIEEGTATALVTKAVAPLLMGDRVGKRKQSSVAAAGNDPALLPVNEQEQVRQLVKKIDDLAKDSNGQASLRLEESGKRVVLSLDELVDHLYFDSGEATVKPEGQPILKKIADLVKEGGDRRIRVEGHADNQEIGPTLKNRFPTNLELSQARAAGVARFLVQEAGLDADNVTTVGYGATNPVAPNTTEAGRQKNRRVEITFQTPEAEAAPAQGTSQPDGPQAAAPQVPLLNDQSVPSKDPGGTTLSTVATPSLGDSVPSGTSSTSSHDSLGEAQDRSQAPGSDAASTDKTSALPAADDKPADRGSL